MRQYLINESFIEIHIPKLIGTASESGADVFEIEYFDRGAYLAQSHQLINRWRWYQVLNVFLKLVRFFVQKSPIQVSIQQNLKVLI